MKQVVQNYRSGKLAVEEVPAPTVRAGCVLVAVRASLISVGTERSTVSTGKKSLVGKAMDRPDLVRKVFDKAQKDGIVETMKMVSQRLDAPVALGYSCAGTVLGIGEGVDGIAVGDCVACAGQNHASHAEVVVVPKNLCVRVPDAVAIEDAAYVTLGAIALQGVRQADPKLGDIVAVIGLGVVGQLVLQLLKANGCRVLASEPDPEKRVLAKQLGADRVVAPDLLDRTAAAMTEGHGVDAVIVAAAAKSSEPIAAAAGIARKKGRVVVVGAVGMDLPREPFYEKELELRLSMSYGPGRYDTDYEEKGRDYPYGYVRWTERRNMAAFLDLVAQERVGVGALTTHRFRIEEAEKAYRTVLGGSGKPPLGVLLTYDGGQQAASATKLTLRPVEAQVEAPVKAKERIGLALIGAGNHVRDMLLPAIREVGTLDLRAVCTQRGASAKTLADRAGAAYCTTNIRDVLDDSAIDAVLIGTRHNLHAAMVLDALAAGKHVFVEKPLCLTEEELDAIADLYRRKAEQGARLAVGFNRRFSPHVAEAKRFLSGRVNPLVMSCRVNAGILPRDHWTQDPEVGGGRIVGEGCHFIDLLQELCGVRTVSVHAQSIGRHESGIIQDQAVISLRFADGSVGSIVYAGGGDTGLAKERCEVFGDGRTVVIDDFQRTELYRGSKRTLFKTRARDKGFRGEIEAFASSLTGTGEGMAFDDIVAVTRASIRAVRSMETGGVYEV